MALLEENIDEAEGKDEEGEDGQQSKGDESQETETDAQLSERAFVKEWQATIKKDREKFEPDFDRMRDNMDFVAGLQWAGQTKLRDEDERYVVNMTLRTVNQGVAMLYAKNPKVKSVPRDRMDFQRWDGDMATIAMAQQITEMGSMTGMPIPPDVTAMLQDYQQGRLRKQLVKKVGKTLEVLLQYQMDTQTPSFKTQMKQMVRRVRVTGVGYIKVQFCRDYDNELTQSETRSSIVERAKTAKGILDKMEDGKVENHHAAVQQLQSLVESMSGQPMGYDNVAVKERLVFDFPQATSIIPDRRCRILKGFVGARHITEEFHYPLKYVNDFFGVDIEVSSDLKLFDLNRQEEQGNAGTSEGGEKEKEKFVRLWQVYNLDDKSTFIICDGFKDFVQKPDPVEPGTKGFWTIFPVTFNDIEVEEGCKATIFPPSDVDLMFSAQTQWNEVRNRLKRHRRANAPRYMYPDGALDDDDLDRLENSEDQEFVKLKSLQPGMEPSKALQPFATVPIQPQLYDTNPLREDTLLATGQQEANIGPAQPNVTATVGTIAEQSRMSVSASDVDGLDDSLSDAMQCGGEMALEEFSGETVKRIVGVGAVWPEQNRDEFVNELDMTIVAASSGRPNKAIDVANWERLAPLILQSGGNPKAVVEETIKRLDDNLDPAPFFPPQSMPGQPPPGQEQQNGQGQGHGQPPNGQRPKPHPQGGGPQRPNGPRPPQPGQFRSGSRHGQPLQQNKSGISVPLAGHNPS